MCGINGFNYADKELLQRMEKFTQKVGYILVILVQIIIIQ